MADGGGPTEQDRNEGMPSLGEAPNVRGKSAWLLGVGPRRLLQVTRRQGGTISRRNRSNGYTPSPINPQCNEYKPRPSYKKEVATDAHKRTMPQQIFTQTTGNRFYDRG